MKAAFDTRCQKSFIKRFPNDDICEMLGNLMTLRGRRRISVQSVLFETHLPCVHVGHTVACETIKLKSIDSKPCNRVDIRCTYGNRTILRWIFVRHVVVTRYILPQDSLSKFHRSRRDYTSGVSDRLVPNRRTNRTIYTKFITAVDSNTFDTTNVARRTFNKTSAAHVTQSKSFDF